MATSSIYKELKTKDKRSIAKLIGALERSKESAAQEVQMTRPVRDLTKEQINRIFGGTDGGVRGRKP